MIAATLRNWHQRHELNWTTRPIEVECVQRNPTNPSKPSLYLLLTDNDNNRIVIVLNDRNAQRLTRELAKPLPHPHSGEIPH